jgi:pyridoxine 4-dehydrogenase
MILEAALDLGVRYIDTADSYYGHRSHAALAANAADLLDQFHLSTKIGFFPDRSHSLDPDRLRQALKLAVDTLGRPPDLVFLHNPEQSAAALPPGHRRAALARACDVLAEAVTAGLTRSWGISSWNPSSITESITELARQPQVIMLRSGLTLGARSLHDAGFLGDHGSSRGAARWGMAPFGGEADHPVWSDIAISQFLVPGQDASPVQTALAVAFRLPDVDRVTVGTDDPRHLAELVEATRLAVDEDVVASYGALLARRARFGQ